MYSKFDLSFTLTVKPLKQDYYVYNLGAQAQLIGALQPAAPGPGDTNQKLPPNQNTCGGKYVLDNPMGNYGDPSCTFTKDQLYQQLKALDQKYNRLDADDWYYNVISCESGYNPNAYLKASASGKGAFGLEQMNPGGQGNNSLDDGSENYPIQTDNAYRYNVETINGNWRYWACAKYLWK